MGEWPWKKIADFAILGVGLCGYLLALMQAVRLRVWLGRAARRWPILVLRTVIFFLVGLGILFAGLLLATLGVLGGLPRKFFNYIVAVYLAALPFTFALALHQWRVVLLRRLEREKRRGE